MPNEYFDQLALLIGKIDGKMDSVVSDISEIKVTQAKIDDNYRCVGIKLANVEAKVENHGKIIEKLNNGRNGKPMNTQIKALFSGLGLLLGSAITYIISQLAGKAH